VTTVTFEPDDWDTPVTVTVSCDAATSDRPVCASGNRFCDALNGRSETVVHSVSSSDSYYDSISVSSLSIAVDVVYDLTDPPRVSESRFNNLLNAIVVTFNRDSNRGGFTGSFSCQNVLDLSTSQIQSIFGRGASCSFPGDNLLKITFGSRATVLHNDEISLLDNVIQTSSSTASLFTMNETFIVGLPLSPTIPSVTLSASSSSVGVCDDLTLDASSSSGSGGRAMSYNFSVVSGNGFSIYNVSEVLNSMNLLNGGRGKYRVVIPSEIMPRGALMIFKLEVSNFLNYKGSPQTTSVMKLGIPAPIISIQGSNPRLTTHSDALKLTATARLPSMSCISIDLSNAKMGFRWFEDSGLFTGDLEDTSRNPRILSIPEDSLEPLNTYSFRVIGYMMDSSVNNSAMVDVEVEQQAVVAQITGGSYQQFGRDLSFELDGSGSYDPDASSVSFYYSWTCQASSLTANCTKLAMVDNSSSLAVPALTLPVGDYVFTLFVSKNERNDTAQVDVEIVSGAPPVISITALTQDKYNSGDEFLSLTSSVTSSYTFSTIWSADSSDVANLFMSDGSYASSVSNKLSVVVALSILTEGDTYTLRLTATDSYGESSYSTVSLTMNEPPSSGDIDVTPKNGYALDTSFTFTATNWVDDDLPLTYIFGTTGVNSDATLDTTSLSPFGDERSDASYVGVTLSQGLNSTNYTVGCYTEVVDSYGATGSETASVRVRSKPLSVGELRNISEARARDSIDSNDADGAKQILSATTEGMGSTTDGTSSRRRQLLGANSDAQELRASVLANLWATYAITPITVSDVASLLSVLVGVVDTPVEVTYEVASGSNFFLQTLLRATIGANIGISSTSTDYVGSFLTYLFETPWFNETLSSSYVNAANVSNAIGLVSAAQLYNAYDGVGYALSEGDVDMFSYRTAASTLLDKSTIYLSGGGSSDTVTSAYFSANVSDLITASGESSLVSSDLLDLRITKLGTNLYAGVLKGTYNSQDAIVSRLDQKDEDLNGIVLLRSDVTMVDLSIQDSSVPMDISSFSSFKVTLAATVVFNTSFDAFDRTFSCGGSSDGVVIDLNCPITSDTHTCDHTTYGEGGAYYFEYTCPYVEPTCLYWDEATMDFEGNDCTLVSGYTSDAVTCECTRTGTFVLGANVTEPKFEAFTTPAPTSVPTSIPTPSPTHIPTPSPTDSPTYLPTYLPTSKPTSLPTNKPSLSPTNDPTKKPTPLPSLSPSFSPSFLPTMKPTSSPTLSPTTSPTSLPTNHPTLSPTTSPTLIPTPLPTTKPTMSPTLNPTVSSTASVAVEFDVTATGPPSTDDKTTLQSSIANATGVDESSVKNFVVSYTVSRRRLSPDDHRRLSTYTWTVNFDIQIDLSVVSSVSSSSDLASSVNTQLSSSTFENTLKNKLTTTISSVSAVVTVAATRSPSFVPLPAPTPVPLPAPTLSPVISGAGGSGSGMNGSSSSENASMTMLIVLLVVACVLIVVGIIFYKKYLDNQALKVSPHDVTTKKSHVNLFVDPQNSQPATEDDVAKMLGAQSAEV
jgi:hypothetical protein